jgi:hypothetical protein
MKDSTLKANYALEKLIARISSCMYTSQIDQHKVNFVVFNTVGFMSSLSSMKTPQRDNKQCIEVLNMEPVIII